MTSHISSSAVKAKAKQYEKIWTEHLLQDPTYRPKVDDLMLFVT